MDPAPAAPEVRDSADASSPAQQPGVQPPNPHPTRPAASDESTRGYTERSSPWNLLVELVAPLAVYYAARALGLSPEVALVVGAGLAIARLAWVAIRRRRVERSSALVLSLIIVGSAVGMIAGDAQLIMARGSWVTVVVGLWLLASLHAKRPAIFTATLPFLPEPVVEEWDHAWNEQPQFRRLMRAMTAAFGVAFLLDAAARIIMVFTLPLDAVPILSTLLLLLMLSTIVLVSKAAARRFPPQEPHPGRS